MRFSPWKTTVTLVMLAACASDSTQPLIGLPSLYQIFVSLAAPTLPVGQTTQASATLVDSAGRSIPAPGETVEWASSNPGVASISKSTGMVTAIAAGTTTISASAQGKVATADLTVTPAGSGVAKSISVSLAAPTLNVGRTTQATATVKDADGNVLSDLPVTWNTSDANIARVSSTGTVSGREAGTATIMATADGLTGAAPVTVTSSVAAQLTITTQPSPGAQSGAALSPQPVIQLSDASGNAVSQSGVAVTASIATGSGTLGGTLTATTDANGVATFSNLQITGTGSHTIRFAAADLDGVTSNTITIGSGAPTSLAITTQPSASAASGSAFARQPVIQLRDASGNAVSQSGVAVTATIASGGGTLGGTARVTTNASGVATFSGLSITGTIGNRTLRFAAPSLTAVTSASIIINAGSASRLAIANEPSTTAQSGVAFSTQPAVRVQDASGNPVSQSGVTVTAAVATGSGTLGGTLTATTNANGVATFSNLRITGSGSHTLRFVANGLAAVTFGTIAVAASSPVATQVAIETQPSATAQSGVAFTTQPVVRLRDASNNAVSQSGVVVTAAIATGGGTLGGAVTATTNSSGVATFTNLSIAGANGTRTLNFSAPSLTGATSTSVTLVSTVPPSGLYPNRPASFTQSTEIDFSQAIPSSPDNVDRPISGASGWNMIYFGDNWSKTSDAGAPQSAPGIWQGRWAPGAYGGGVIGQGGGHGIGNLFTYAPSGTTRLYMSMRLYFDFDASLWHPISNKFVNLEGDHSLILMQLREGGNWRHAEELGSGGSFFVDDGADAPGEAHIPGQVSNRAVPNRQWTQIEVLIDIPNHVYKIWQDGVLTTDASPTFASTRINMVGVYAFRGGGGETLSTDLYYKYDHFFVAW